MSPSPGDELPGLDEPIFQSLVAILYDPRDRGCRARIAVRRVGPEHIAVYGAYAVPLVALVLGWIAWIWRSGASPAGQVAPGMTWTGSRICWR